jgi:adenylosuccinate lyase
MTSSDVLDTTFSGQLRDAGWIIDGKIVNYLIALKKRAFENKDIPTVGRTHGIHAEPTTLGLVFAGFYAEMVRNMKRLHKAIESISVGKISGAVGNYGMFLTEYSEAVSLRRLYLRAEDCATQVVARDRYAEFFSILALIAAGVERFALQVRHWQRTEVGEVYEGFTKGQKGSSAMPHKKNPILSENLCGLSRLVRGYANTAMENIALWHERDISHSSVERVIGPDATILVDFMLHRATGLVNNLVIDYSRVDANLNMTKGLIFSSALLLKMVQKGVPRQEAYELVQSHALYAAKQKMDFFQKCINSKEMLRVLSSSEIGDCFNLQNNYKNVCNIFDRVFGYFDE